MNGLEAATRPAPTAPLVVPGFRFAGIACGIKRAKPDLALLVCDGPSPRAAAVFTQNGFAAAPVQWSRDVVRRGDARAVIVNSGNANACTGRQGRADCEEMAQVTAGALDLRPDQVLVASTGVIGKPLPMQPVRSGIPAVTAALADDGLPAFAKAIMTTDRTQKTAATTVQAGDRTFHIAGASKGVGMLHPNMATMLAFLTTDAPVQQDALDEALRDAVGRSFNQISVDGDESTNDMALLMASGAEGGPELGPADAAWAPFVEGVRGVCIELARAMVADGEGAEKRLEVQVHGAADAAEARRAARAVASSTLVKAALHGQDPNWGRVVAAAGSTRVQLRPERVSLTIESGTERVCVLAEGEPADDDARRAAKRLLAATDVTFHLDLASGPASGTAWGCDLTEEYVRFNSEYTT